MKSFCIASVGAIIAIIMGLYCKSIVLFFMLCFLFLLLFFITKKKHTHVILFIFCFIAFYSYTCLLENEYEQISSSYDNQEIKMQAVIVSNGEEKEYKKTYKMKVEKVENLKQAKYQHFYLVCNIKKPKEGKIQLQYGDKIELIATFEKPSSARNEGGFDYQQYLKTRGIVGMVTVKNEDVLPLQKNQANWLESKIFSLKNTFIEKIKSILPKSTQGVCIGLLLGDKTLIPEDTKEDFRKSSLSHMLAISGAHVSYLLLGITSFLSTIKLHKRWSKLIVIVFLIFFMALVEFTPSVTRACIMAILTLLADIVFRKSNVYQNLGISSFIILLANPYALLDIGFQLSFGGTIGIVIFMNQKSKKAQSELQVKENSLLLLNPKSKWISKVLTNIKQIITVSLYANFIILPIMLYHFNTFSATFLISNLLASPILGVCLILGMVFVLFIIFFQPIAQLLSYFLNPLLQLLIQIANITSNLPLSQILLPTPTLFQIFIYYFLIFLFYQKRKQSRKRFIQKESLPQKYQNQVNSNCNLSKLKHNCLKKAITIFLILLLLIPYFTNYIPTNQLKIYFIDVGQGDSMLIQTPSNKTILIDGGGSETGSFDVGNKTLLPFLLEHGVMKIDYMMFSHLDSDHCAGLFTILEKLKVKNIIISKQGKNSNNFKQLQTILQNKKVNMMVVQAQDQITIDKHCYFSILFPQEQQILENVLNNNSIVAKFCMQNTKKQVIFSMLLTGDIEKIAEEQLISLYQNNKILQSTILKVAHHRF